MFYILTGGRVPLLLIDEEGDPAPFESLEAARASARHHMLCQARGYIVLEWDADTGLVEVHD